MANKGPVLVARDIVGYLVKKGITVHLYYFDNKKEINFDCQCFKISFFSKVAFDSYDIIHSHSLRPDLYSGFRIKKNKVKKITTTHNYYFDDLKLQYGIFRTYVTGFLWLLALRRFNKIVCLSENMRNYYSRVLQKKKLTHIYNGRIVTFGNISEQHNVLLSQIKRQFTLIGVVALLIKRKAIHQVIEALTFNEQLALVIIGDGPHKDVLMHLSKKKNVNDRCFFLGYQKDGHRYFKYFDIYAMTSYSEGFPLALLEAAYAGIPTVCIDTPLFRELFPSEVVFYTKNSPHSLYEAVMKIFSQKKLYSDLIMSKASSEYSPETMGHSYLKLYKEINSL